MPKRLPAGTKPFQPLEKALVNEVLAEAVATLPEPEEPGPPPPTRTEKKVVGFPGPTQTGRASRPEADLDDDQHISSAPMPDHLTRVLKAKVSSSEHAELKDLVNQLAVVLDTPVSTTHVLRALITILRHAEPNVVKRARQQGPLKRPSNDDLAAIAAFEFRLAKVLSAALRDAPPLRELQRE